MDGDDDPNYHSQGPTLLHFTSSLDDVVNRPKKSWKQILDQFIPLPTPKVHIYDRDGNHSETRVFATIPTHMSDQFSYTMSCTGSFPHSSDPSSSASPLSRSSHSSSSGSPLSHQTPVVVAHLSLVRPQQPWLASLSLVRPQWRWLTSLSSDPSGSGSRLSLIRPQQ